MNIARNDHLAAEKAPKTRVAFCLRGGVSKISGGWGRDGSCKEYVNYRAVAASLKRHIFSVNGHMHIDVFLQSWSEDIKEDLESLYQPVISLFEDNSRHQSDILARCSSPKDFAGVSQALAMRKAIEMKEEHESRSGFRYDMVVLYRPDVLIWKDMDLGNYDVSLGVHVNGHHGGNGDFHFVMSYEDASSFKGLYDSPLSGNRHAIHHWIKNYVTNFMGRPLIPDSIAPGRHQEVARPDKMSKFALGRYRIKPSVFYEYGMTSRDLGI